MQRKAIERERLEISSRKLEIPCGIFHPGLLPWHCGDHRPGFLVAGAAIMTVIISFGEPGDHLQAPMGPSCCPWLSRPPPSVCSSTYPTAFLNMHGPCLGDLSTHSDARGCGQSHSRGHGLLLHQANPGRASLSLVADSASGTWKGNLS